MLIYSLIGAISEYQVFYHVYISI